MKRKILMILMGTLLIILTGCSSIIATNYNKLSNKEKQNVQFEFNLQENEDADAPDPVYNINMKIKNNTDKKISFNEGKLSYNLEGYKANSKKSETIVIEPKETKNVKNIFKNINEQATVGGAVINYDGKQLLQANFSNSSQSAGTNGDDQSNSSDTTDSTDNNTDTTNHHLTREEAEQILESKQEQYGFTEPVSSMQAEEFSHMWKFTTVSDGQTLRFYVLDNGDVRALQGNFQ